MSRPRIVRTRDGHVAVERFRLGRRLEHLLMIASFTTLLLTGFPQKFADGSISHWIVSLFGGLENMRLVHRVAGVVFALHAVVHLAIIALGGLTGRMRMTMMPTIQDARDLWQNLRFYLGRRAEPPKLPVFDYRQKFEYLGMVLGGLLMIASGLVLMFPVQVGQFVSGEVVLALRAAHSFEAVLAFVVLLIWHVYGAVLSPDVFPLDKSMFTGFMSAHHLRAHHRLEYERLFGDAPLEVVEAPPSPAQLTPPGGAAGEGDRGLDRTPGA
ncbi:MAG: cytochrome b/b6 domain-containing protein [Myxococcales bacterium]|nr:cytochrome b/b6 domain-containing protein [Myxococcales bacterium]